MTVCVSEDLRRPISSGERGSRSGCGCLEVSQIDSGDCVRELLTT